MDYVTALVQHFISIPVEKFTDKLISAFQIAKVVPNFNKTDYNKLLNIEKNTDENVQVSFYKLDRQINPETTGFKRNTYSAEFTMNNKRDDYGERVKIKLTEKQIQDYLCLATRKVAEIVVDNTKDYNMQFRMPNTNNNNGTGPIFE